MAQLRHTEDYVRTLDTDWILHYDADEIRLAPWHSVPLKEAISFVDELGYSAIDFTVINFAFVDQTSTPVFDPDRVKFYDFGRHPAHLIQVKAWKNIAQEIDLASNGGHNVFFAERRVYPLKFLNKHYPLRSTEQANRKVFTDRLPRMFKEKSERGWHTHYDTYQATAVIMPWRRFELLNFDARQFAAEFLVERLSGIGIETESRAIPNIEMRLAEMRRFTAGEGA